MIIIRKSSLEQQLVTNDLANFVNDPDFVSSLSLELEDESLSNNYAQMEEIKEETRKSSRKLIAINQNFVRVFIKHLKPQNFELNQTIIQSSQYYSQLSHPNLLQFIEIIEEDDDIKIVTEYMNQASYFKKKIIEVPSKKILWFQNMTNIKNDLKIMAYLNDILEGLDYLHNRGFVHSDLRLEKLFCFFEEGLELREVKIAGLELVKMEGDLINSFDLQYMKENQVLPPPELDTMCVFRKEMDIWCLGVALYKICMGYNPSLERDNKIFFRKIDWKNRNKQLQNIITQMLQIDPQKRPTCNQLQSMLDL